MFSGNKMYFLYCSSAVTELYSHIFCRCYQMLEIDVFVKWGGCNTEKQTCDETSACGGYNFVSAWWSLRSMCVMSSDMEEQTNFQFSSRRILS